jgi:hypothetical protein
VHVARLGTRAAHPAPPAVRGVERRRAGLARRGGLVSGLVWFLCAGSAQPASPAVRGVARGRAGLARRARLVPGGLVWFLRRVLLGERVEQRAPPLLREVYAVTGARLAYGRRLGPVLFVLGPAVLCAGRGRRVRLFCLAL